MTNLSNPEPDPQTGASPPQSASPPFEPFWDFKASHWVEIVLTAALVFVGVMQLCVYNRQAGIMELQTKISESDHRPWVSANPITLVGEIVHGDTGLQITLMFPMKNTGHSPSRHAFVSFTPSTEGVGPDQYRKTCAKAENSPLGVAIFPGETWTQGVGGTIPEAEFVAAKKRAPGLIDTILPSIVACIAYKDMETDKFHHTLYDFYVSLPSDKSPLQMMINQKTIPSSTLVLVAMPNAPAPD